MSSERSARESGSRSSRPQEAARGVAARKADPRRIRPFAARAAAVMRFVCAVLLCVLLASQAISAQAEAIPLPAGRTFTATWVASTSPNVQGYRVYVDGVQVGADHPATTVSAQLPGLPAGRHLLEVSAFNRFGESPRVSRELEAGDVPLPPGGLRITVTVTTVTVG